MIRDLLPLLGLAAVILTAVGLLSSMLAVAVVERWIDNG